MKIALHKPDAELMRLLYETGYPTMIRANGKDILDDMKSSWNFVDDKKQLWFSVRKLNEDVGGFNFAALPSMRKRWTRGIVTAVFDHAFGIPEVKILLAVRKAWVPHSENAMEIVGFKKRQSAKDEKEYTLSLEDYVGKWWRRVRNG